MALIVLKQMLRVNLITARYINRHNILNSAGDFQDFLATLVVFFKMKDQLALI